MGLNNNDFQRAVQSIRSEADFNRFITENQNDPRIVRMLEMTKGQNAMSIAGNLASSMGVNIGDLRRNFGI